MAILKPLPIQLRSKAVGGKLPGIDKDLLKYILEAVEGKELTLTLDYYVRRRSNAFNRYYWPVCIEFVLEGLIDIGYKRDELSPEIVHDFLKGKLLRHMPKRRVYNPITKKYITKLPKSSDLNTWQFMDYVEAIGQFAAEFLNIQIPAPDKEWKIKAEQDYKEAILNGLITEHERNRVRISLKLNSIKIV